MPRLAKSLSFLLGAFALMILPALTEAEVTDSRLRDNPALARLYAHDPEAARHVLDELEGILHAPRPEPDESPYTRGLRSPENTPYRELLDENPLFQEAYRINPKAVLQQLDRLVGLDGNR
jgi:hypothetical protein